MRNWYALTPKPSVSETEISIFDEIGMYGISAKQFITDLKAIPATDRITLKIHSPGGEVFDGNAIFNALQRRGNVEVQIEGLAASMATVISLAGMPVKMAANGFYMIHNPWGVAMGDAAELRDQAELLDKIRSNMVGAYAAKSGQDPEQIQEWMDAETWFTAAEALSAGFIDEITDTLSLAASSNKFARMAKFKNAPANLTAQPHRMEIEITPEPEIVEEVIADSIVSDSVPAEEIVIIEEIAPADQVEVAPDATPQPIVSPVSLAAADSILAKYNAILAERDSAILTLQAYSAKVETLRDELNEERESFARLERSLGLSAARVVPIISNAAPEALDPVAEYLAAVESGDRKAASALFEKHKALIWQARQKTISKA
jgi:ATP-dependent Clp endopeptidase proteolytic subunit ClpP